MSENIVNPTNDQSFVKRMLLTNFKMRVYNLHSLVATGHKSANGILDLIQAQRNLKFVIKLIDDPIIRQYLYHDKLQRFWDEQLQDAESLATKLDLEYDYSGLQPHPIIPSLHLIIGYYFYDKACCINQPCEKKTGYLLKAAEYGCFSAILKLNNDIFDKFRAAKDTDKHNIIVQMFTLMTRSANLHATPGFLHLAKTCLHIGDYWHSVDNSLAAATSYTLALQHLYTAKKLLPCSNAIINNAYFGEGLAASTAFKFNTIEDAIDLILTTYPNSLDQITIARAQTEATLAASNLSPIFARQSSPDKIDNHLATNELAHYDHQHLAARLMSMA